MTGESLALHEDVVQRITCIELRMRLEECGDALVQEMFNLNKRPFTKYISARIMATLGRVSYPPNEQDWRVVADAVQAHRMLCDVLHGRNAWNRVPKAKLKGWKAAVEAYERLIASLGLDLSVGPDD